MNVWKPAAITLFPLLLLADVGFANDFWYFPPGDLIPGSGIGLRSCVNYSPGAKFPLEAPAYANSQVYNPGGSQGNQGGQCSSSNYDYPWRDNFCETRGKAAGANPLCPDQTFSHHAGQDIRPMTCHPDTHWVVAVASGMVTHVPTSATYWVDVTRPDGSVDSYLHMSSIQVGIGEEVLMGQHLGKVSNEFGGDPTTWHLHFERHMAVAGQQGIVPVPPYIALVDAYRREIGLISSGTRVQANASVDIFNTPGGNIVGVQSAGDTGIVSGSSVVENFGGYCWIWRFVEWDDGIGGWVQDNYIARTESQATPSPPSSLLQFGAGRGSLPTGSTTNAGTVQFQGGVSSPLGRLVRLEVEVLPTSIPFSGVAQAASPLLTTGSEATICVTGLSDGPYHWRARTVDDKELTSAWSFFGSNFETQADFNVQANQCALCTSSGTALLTYALSPNTTCASPLGVTLTPDPSSGPSPLNAVDLASNAQTSSDSSITYTFYCDRPDAGTDIVSGYALRTSTTSKSRLATDICDYPLPGIYTAKIIVEQDSNTAEARVEIEVGQPLDPPDIFTQAATDVGQVGATLNLTANPRGSSTTVWFQWGTSETSLLNVTPALSIGSGTSPVSRGWTLTSLTCDTTYYFQAWADGGGLPVSGATLSFRTTVCPGGGGESEELILNGDFSGDSANWAISGNFFADDRFSNHRSFPGYAYLSEADGDPGNNLVGTLHQQVSIPADADTATLTYWVSITTSEPSGSGSKDVLTSRVQDQNGNFLRSLEGYSNQGASSGYFKDQFDLSEFLGDTVRIHFLGTTNATNPTVFRIDDVSLLVTYDDPDSAFDLVAFNPSVDDSTPTPGSKVRLSFSTTNNGDVTAPANVEVTYFLDGTPVAFDSEETSLAPGQIDGEAESFFVPEEHGTYSAWACLDAYPEEPTVSNNCTSHLTLTVADDPTEGSDLVIVQTTPSKTTVFEGEQFQISALVRNIGNQSSDLTSVLFVATQDGFLDRDDFLLEDKAVNRLSPGSERTETETVTAFPEPGTYLAGGCILGRNSETNTSNNCSPDPFVLTVLSAGCSPETVSLSNTVVTTLEAHEACVDIDVGPDVTVESTGSLTLKAPRVSFGEGFSVRTGGTLAAGPVGNSWIATEALAPPGELGSSGVGVDHDGVVYATTNRSCQDQDALGVLHSTDEGNSWTSINSGLISTNVRSIAVSPSNEVYIGAHDGVYRLASDRNSWTATGLSGVDVSVMLATSGAVYAGDGCFCSGVWRSTDQGESWQSINSGLATCVNGLAGSSDGDLFAGSGTNGVFRLSQGSSTWQAFSTGLTSSNVTWLAIDVNDTLYATTVGGGIFKRPASSGTWTALNSGLTNNQVETIGVALDQTLFAGTQGSGVFVSKDDGSSWQETNSGILDTTKTPTIFAFSPDGRVFAALGPRIYRSQEKFTP